MGVFPPIPARALLRSGDVADRKAHHRGGRTSRLHRSHPRQRTQADRQRLLALLEDLDDEALEHFLALATLLSRRSKSGK